MTTRGGSLALSPEFHRRVEGPALRLREGTCDLPYREGLVWKWGQRSTIIQERSLYLNIDSNPHIFDLLF
ncbi:MAG TPA: hypothetical protein VGA95_14750 [Thermodesulfobacteriota bacterium]